MPSLTPAEYESLIRRRKEAAEPAPAPVPGPRLPPVAAKKKRRGVLNGLESLYHDRLLVQVALNEIRFVLEHESIALRIANGAQFRPDFPVIALDGVLEFHECKGFWREAARVRIKVAARAFPHFRFFGVRRIRGEWKWERFEP